MREKAYRSLVDTISTPNNDVNVSAIVYRDDYEAATKVRYKVMLNGKAIEGVVAVLEQGQRYKQEVMIKIYELVAAAIAEKLVLSLPQDGI